VVSGIDAKGSISASLVGSSNVSSKVSFKPFAPSNYYPLPDSTSAELATTFVDSSAFQQNQTVILPLDPYANYSILAYGTPGTAFNYTVIPDDNHMVVNNSKIRVINAIYGNETQLQGVIFSDKNGENAVPFLMSPGQVSNYTIRAPGDTRVTLLNPTRNITLTYNFAKNAVYSVWLFQNSKTPKVVITRDDQVPSTSGLSKVAIAFIVVGCILGGIVIIGAVVFVVYRRADHHYERISK